MTNARAHRFTAAALSLFAATMLAAQTRPPVVLLNGYQSSCQPLKDSSATFGQLEKKLTAQGVTVFFFDNCQVASTSSSSTNSSSTNSDRPTIEALGQAFGHFLDSKSLTRVDVVAHSMGGLIVRAYLAGMLPGGGFNPPPTVKIRKAVFLATPNFGSLALAFAYQPPIDAQLNELLPGSAFVWSINTANQGSYDFRGVDLLSVAGNNAGTTPAPHTSDGAVPLTSTTLTAGSLRVIPACHTSDLPSFICSGTGIADVDSDSHLGYRLVNSFLAGSEEWRSVGTPASQDAVLSQFGGAAIAVADSDGNISKTTKSAAALQGDFLGNASTGIFFADLMPAGQYDLAIGGAGSGNPSRTSFAAVPGAYLTRLVKTGPRVDSVASATGPVPTLSRAPGMLVAIYGAALSGASVTVAGHAAQILYSSNTQINTVLPESLSGVVPLRVSTAQGSHTVNLFIAPAVPALFSLALHADGTLVSAASPARSNETITVFATGLAIDPATPLSAALGGSALSSLSYAKVAPGLYAVSFLVPRDTVSGSSLILESAGFASNAVTLPTAAGNN